MVTRDAALNLANLWVAAWNAHDLDLIMTHYEDAVELTSPVAARETSTCLKPLFERMRIQGSDFLDKNVALS